MLKQLKNSCPYKYSTNIPSVLFATLATIGLFGYISIGSENISASFLLVIAFICLYFAWTKSIHDDKRTVLFFYSFSLIFSFFTVFGKHLDLSTDTSNLSLLATSFLLSFLFYPCISFVVKALNKNISAKKSVITKKTLLLSFLFVALSWFMVYLAVFPGIWANDAGYWYAEFDGLKSLSSQWSLPYAGIFYAFLKSSLLLTGDFTVGMAIFTTLQMSFLLFVTYKMLALVGKKGNKALLIISTIFLALPTHALVATQSAQGAILMGVLVLFILQLYKILTTNKATLGDFIKLGLLAIIGCLFRNNMLYVLVLFVATLFFFWKKLSVKELILTLSVSILLIFAYNGPFMNLIGASNNSAIREILGIPAQQISRVYSFENDNLSNEDKEEISSYIKEENMLHYPIDQSISDTAKWGLDTAKISSSPIDFALLYTKLGLRYPSQYFSAFMMNDLGLIYIDKQYPDGRMWHNYLAYDNIFATYNIDATPRITLFPQYDNLLKWLFGANDGYTLSGEVKAHFSTVPILASLFRASTYFWLILFIVIYYIYQRNILGILIGVLFISFLITIILSPVILYRYCAPIIFVVPLLLIPVFTKQSEQ